MTCRGCCMPWANGVLGFRPAKFLTNLFPKIYDDLYLVICFSLSGTVAKLSNLTKILSLDAPSAASCPSKDIFLFFSCPIFFTKTDPLYAPQNGRPGSSHRPAPLKKVNEANKIERKFINYAELGGNL